MVEAKIKRSGSDRRDGGTVVPVASGGEAGASSSGEAMLPSSGEAAAVRAKYGRQGAPKSRAVAFQSRPPRLGISRSAAFRA